ncbi:hypothetical protein ACOMHN_000856 [Nucella lapillus]
MNGSTTNKENRYAGVIDLGNRSWRLVTDSFKLPKCPSCMLCSKMDNLQKCGRCFGVYYCSKDCQRLDWTTHRKVCLALAAYSSAKRAEQDQTTPDKGVAGGAKTSDGDSESGSSPEPGDTCKNCKCKGQSFKTCSRCSAVTYCSKDCQRNDWKVHKKKCRRMENTELLVDLFGAMDPFPTIRRSPRPALSWDQALDEAVRRSRPKSVLTQLRDVPEERVLGTDNKTSAVFLARLVEPYPYVVRHAWCLEDKRGKQVRLFYLDGDLPEPFFQWWQLDVGTFLCLEHAYIHTFFDSSTGIRMDDASCVQVIGD